MARNEIESGKEIKLVALPSLPLSLPPSLSLPFSPTVSLCGSSGLPSSGMTPGLEFFLSRSGVFSYHLLSYDLQFMEYGTVVFRILGQMQT